MQSIKPIITAFKGKGSINFLKRVWTIHKRYGMTVSKMDHSLARLVQILQQFDGRATLPITASTLARNGEVIKKYQARGIEFAIHGCYHIDHSQLTRAEQDASIQKAGQIFQEQGIHFQGFRAPYLRWNDDTLKALKKNRFLYDTSSSLFWEVQTKHITSSYERALSFYGAKPATEYLSLPHFDTTNDFIQIAYCLPDDESLIERLHWDSPHEMNQTWLDMFHQIHEQGELFNLGLHPERTFECATALIKTFEAIENLKSSSVWLARLSEVATWWKARYYADVKSKKIGDDLLQLIVNGPNGTALLLRSLEAKTATHPWFDGYQYAEETPCIIQSHQRPFIGISPESDKALISCLKQHGYIIEISSQPNLYHFYLDRKQFLPQEERSLIQKIESEDFPLVRLGRWPNGARSTVTITGDIDALTIWDYFFRLFGH